ncbi:MAG: hypothetical protein V2B13_19280 [Pseudomonadota bacterium]
MGDMEVEKISNHQAEVGHFGVEADEEAIGKIIDKIETDDRLIEKISSDDETLRKIIVKLQSGYYQPELAEPASGTNDLDSLMGGYDLLAQVENIGILFHNVVRHLRDTQRHDSVFMQHKIVETQNAAAEKKDEASDKLGDAALTGLILTLVGFAVGLAFAGLGPLMMSSSRPASQAATKATQEAAKSAKEVAAKATALQRTITPQARIGSPTLRKTNDAANTSRDLQHTTKMAKGRVKEANQFQEDAKNATTKAVKKDAQIHSKAKAVEANNGMRTAVQQAKDNVSTTKTLNQLVRRGWGREAGVNRYTYETKQQTSELVRLSEKNLKITQEAAKKTASFSNSTLKKIGQGFGEGAVKTLMTPMASAMYFTGAQQYATTKGQADSQKSQADGDRLSALAEGEKSQKQRTDDYTSTFTDSMKTVRQKLSEMIESVQRGMEAAAKI